MLEKTAYVGNAGSAGCGIASTELKANANETITVCYTIHNEGGFALENITLNDSILGELPISVLPEGKSLPAGANITLAVSVKMEALLANSSAELGARSWKETTLLSAYPVSDSNVSPSSVNRIATSVGFSVTEANLAYPVLANQTGTGIYLEKLVYAGHASIAGCKDAVAEIGAATGDAITFCFVVKNTGSESLGDLGISDKLIGIERGLDVPENVFSSGSTFTYAVETYVQDSWISKTDNSIVNSGLITARTLTNDGQTHLVAALDSARVVIAERIALDGAVFSAQAAQDINTASPAPTASATALPLPSLTPSPKLGMQMWQKLLPGAHASNNCQSEQASGTLIVTGEQTVTFCFFIKNIGNTPLSNIKLAAELPGFDQLVIPNANTSVLQVNDTLIYSLQSQSKNSWFPQNRTNVVSSASVSALASDASGKIADNAPSSSAQSSATILLATTNANSTATNTPTVTEGNNTSALLDYFILAGEQTVESCNSAFSSMSSNELLVESGKTISFCIRVENNGDISLNQIKLQIPLLNIERQLLSNAESLSVGHVTLYAVSLVVDNNWFVLGETLTSTVTANIASVKQSLTLQDSYQLRKISNTPLPSATPSPSPTAINGLELRTRAYAGKGGIARCEEVSQIPLVKIGETISVCFEILNIGNQPVTDIILENELLGIRSIVISAPASLDGQSSMLVAIEAPVQAIWFVSQANDANQISIKSMLSGKLLENGALPSVESTFQLEKVLESAEAPTLVAAFSALGVSAENASPTPSGTATISLSASPTNTPTPTPSPSAVATKTVGGRVWYDINQNHLVDASEQGARNVTILLIGNDGSTSQTTVTDGNGSFSFAGISMSGYRLEIQLPSGFGLASPLVGTDSTVDSDFDILTRQTIQYFNSMSNINAGLVGVSIQTQQALDGKKVEATEPIKKKEDATPTPTDPIKKKEDATPTATEPIKKKEDATPTPTDPIKKKEDATPTATEPIKKKEDATATEIAKKKEETATPTAAVLGATLVAPVIVKSSDIPKANIGDTVTYTISITNSNTQPLEGIVLSDTLDSRLDFVSAQTSIGQVSINGRIITVNIGTLPASTTAVATIKVLINSSAQPNTQISNIARVNSSGFQPVNSKPAVIEIVPSGLPTTGERSSANLNQLLLTLLFLAGLVSVSWFAKRNRVALNNSQPNYCQVTEN